MQSEPRAAKSSQGRHIEGSYFLRALKDGGTFSRDYQRLYGELEGISTAASEFVSDLLRHYTDEWLATGIDPDKKENPFARKLTDTKAARAAVMKRECSLAPEGIDWNNGIQRMPFSFADQLKANPEDMVRPVTATLQKIPLPTPDVNDPWQSIRAHRRAKRAETTPTHPNMPKSISAAAKLRAAIIFHAFMKAPWRYRLGKCKRCQTYFILKVNPSRIPYVRGMHCSKCKSPVSAGASAKAKRADRERQLIGLAADVWHLWRPARQFGDRNEWIAKQVSSTLGEKWAIQRNWVTRHEKEVVAAAKKSARNPIPVAPASAAPARREIENQVSATIPGQAEAPFVGRRGIA